MFASMNQQQHISQDSFGEQGGKTKEMRGGGNEFGGLLTGFNQLKLEKGEADARDVQPRFEEEEEDIFGKKRAHTTPANYLQWLNKPKITESEEDEGPDEGTTLDQQSDAISNMFSPIVMSDAPNRRMSSNVFATSDMKTFLNETSPVDMSWKPENADMPTPQASMLLNLRGRLRIFMGTSNQELSVANTIRTCRSHTDVNDGASEKLRKKNASVERMGDDKSSDGLGGDLSTSENNSTRTSAQMGQPGANFHDLNTNFLLPMKAPVPAPAGPKLFRSRAKSEAANKREKLYKEKV